jgi:hypothetical protein
MQSMTNDLLEAVPRLATLSDVSRLAQLDVRTVRKRLLSKGILPDALTGSAHRTVHLYSINRVWPVLFSAPAGAVLSEGRAA